ncbi:serine/threonine-protein kinase [Blastopirellula marina]|uniref:non-specific serine/threonine protein kinase n=1 Tax=Blastopirellula marina TaxID=124 RepID=A0A2S8GLL5_9BACT|nr:serine/threonine-protein kinase [Blastopirellula marina]PQO45328.1 serine/threonine protein kinase [Blastopirellula marina]
MSTTDNPCCHADKLHALVCGTLVESEEQSIQAHLDTCQECRQKLEQTAADPDSWVEATTFLKDDPWRSSFVGDPPDAGSPAALPIQQTLELLQPTDDPSMLGRLGGYEISGVIGSGGMGVVLKGIDCSLDRIVAVKVLSPHLASTAAARKRFEREAKAAAAVLHPNVIAIHAVSVDSPLPFLVMPYVRGATLQKRIDREGMLPLVDVLRIGLQIAEGLAAAHDQGLVHRDIKPSNILLEDGIERVTITDFGLARTVDDASITRTNIIAGTPQFMSPEQASGEPVDVRSDLFSLGSVLYTICAGRPPFRAETTFGVLRKITDHAPRPLREINPDVPVWLALLIGRLMQKTPAARYATAHHVAELLRHCVAHATTPNTPLPRELRTTWRLTRTKVAWASLSALATSLLVAAWMIQGPTDPPQRSAAPPPSPESSADNAPPTMANAPVKRFEMPTTPNFSVPYPHNLTTPPQVILPQDDFSWEISGELAPSAIAQEANQLEQQAGQPFLHGNNLPVDPAVPDAPLTNTKSNN